MPFRFAYICNLLEKLHHIFARHPPYLPRDVQQMSTRVITLWFKKHKLKIKQEADGLLLLSILLPAKHTDRIYGLSERDLAKVVGRAFSLSTAQFEIVLNKAHQGDLSDLGHRVELVTRQWDLLPHSSAYGVSIEEIDQALSTIASERGIASHPSQSQFQKSFPSALNGKLGPLYHRLEPRERKWLTRLILKSYAPIVMPDDLVLSLFHPLLPGLILVNFDLKAALNFIRRVEEPPAPLAADRIDQIGGDRTDIQPQEGNNTVLQELAAQIDRLPVVDENAPTLKDTRITPNAQEAEQSSLPGQRFTTSSNAKALRTVGTGNSNSSPAKALRPLFDNTSRFPSKVRAEESQASRRTSSQDANMLEVSSPARPTKEHGRQLVCSQEGRHCLFYNKDIGLLPSISKNAKLAKLLCGHHANTMTFEAFVRSQLKKTRTSKGRTRRRILLVDRSLCGAEMAVEELKVSSARDGQGRKQWVDVYDWRLLDYVHNHGSCRDSKLECIRRFWIGTV